MPKVCKKPREGVYVHITVKQCHFAVDYTLGREYTEET